MQALASADLSISDIHSLNSIDLKADELGMLALAQHWQLPFTTYSVDQLSQMEPWLSTRSDYVYKTVGVYGVAESAALFAAQSQANSLLPSVAQPPQSAELIVKKIKNRQATCAIARAYGLPNG